jgi:hypothetical protein
MDNQKEWLSGERTSQELWELLKAAHYFNLNPELIELITTLSERAHRKQQSVSHSTGAYPICPHYDSHHYQLRDTQHNDGLTLRIA